MLPPERIARFVEDGFPIVCLDRDVSSPAVPLVQVDNRMGARMATEHLLALGHRRIAHIMGAPARISEERLLGYQGALEVAGVSPDSALVALGSFTETGGHDAMCALLETRARPHRRVRGQRPLGDRRDQRHRRERARACPATSPSSASTTSGCARYTSPPLTTVHQPADEIARHSTELLLGMIAGRRPRKIHHLFVPELVVRSSTAALR